MSRGWQVRFRWQTLLICLAVSRAAFAGWELTPPGDPNRNWSVKITSGGSYDDNFGGTEKNRQAGFEVNSDIALRASVPLERCLVGLNYDYGVSYPRDIHLGGINETHNLNLSANYIPTPRLTLGLNESFISSLQPELVRTQAGVPVTVVQAGDYIYDNVAGNLNYALTPRWNLAVNGSWDIWRYDVPVYAQANDREDYQTTLSALHVLDQRTTVGVNYQYSQSTFVNPGTNNALNAQSHTAYLSLVRRFNPRLSLQLNSGYTIWESADGSTSTAPSEYGSLVYNYNPNNTVSLGIGHTLSEATTTGAFRQFSASENTFVALQVNHQLTVRLRTVADVTYVVSSFKLPVQTTTLSASEQAFTGHLGFAYGFTDWLGVNLDYYYTRLITDLPGLTYDRDVVSLSISLLY